MPDWSRRDGDRCPERSPTGDWGKKVQGETMRMHHSLILGLFSSFLRAPPSCLFFVCVLECDRVCMGEKEGALAPESALWGDHSCTLPAANWSLSSCPIHLHFLPITEHYLCSQLGMGLNPFWLSWCYSLQILKWRQGGACRGEETDGKVYGKRSGGTSCREKKVRNFPASLSSRKHSVHGDVIGRRTNMDAINYWRYNSGPCLQTLPSYWSKCSCCTRRYWPVQTIFPHHRWFSVRSLTGNSASWGRC